MISPSCTAVAARIVSHQPLKSTLRLRRPFLIARHFVKPNEAACKKAHAFAGPFLLYAEERPQIDRETPDSLLENLAKKLLFEGKGSDKPRIQAIKGVISLIIISLEPARQPLNRIE
jgi:hypothetical protein